MSRKVWGKQIKLFSSIKFADAVRARHEASQRNKLVSLIPKIMKLEFDNLAVGSKL